MLDAAILRGPPLPPWSPRRTVQRPSHLPDGGEHTERAAARALLAVRARSALLLFLAPLLFGLAPLLFGLASHRVPLVLLRLRLPRGRLGARLVPDLFPEPHPLGEERVHLGLRELLGVGHVD